MRPTQWPSVLAIALLTSNISRVFLHRSQLDRPLVKWFAIGSVPAAVLGSLIFVAAPAQFLTRTMGVFLLLALIWVRWGWGGVRAGICPRGQCGAAGGSFDLALGLTQGCLHRDGDGRCCQ
ncbi:MAG: sulfite exporter TauE/SafE family protein [Actinomycetia bacterium]|nr:sulfite exporter TauE/SafE family protein [Actinomycetes bacterium]